MTRLTTRGIATAQAIANRQPFTTSGSLKGQTWHLGSGRLPSGAPLDRFYEDANHIDYVVTSYATPIAWHTPERGWVVPDVKYSVTTSRHQGNLYLILDAADRPA